MNVTVQAADLTRELMFLEKIVTNKATIPVLANVLLQAHGGWLYLATTDLEVALTTACVATTVEDGAVTLPARKLLELTRSLEGAAITFILDAKNQIHLTSGIFHLRLQMWPVEDFPVLPTHADLAVTALPRAAFLDMLKKTRFATADDKRFFMNGAQLTLMTETMGMVALDGKRLALMTAPRSGAESCTALLPVKAMDLLIALFAESSAADLSFVQTAQHLFFEIEGRLLISRTIDGKFPAWERVIPTDHTHVATVDRDALLKVVRRALLVDEIITLTVSETAVAITATSANVGDADEVVPCAYTGPEITLKIRGAHLVDALTAANGIIVTFALKNDKSPLFLTDGAYQNIIMVMV